MLTISTRFSALLLAALCWLLAGSSIATAQTCPAGTTVDGGTIALVSGGDSTSICAGDGTADPIDITLTGQTGDTSVYVITDTSLTILGLSATAPIDLEGSGDGTCLLWHLSYTGTLTGAAIGSRADSLGGCFDLSNPIKVTRNGVNGGTLTLETGGDTLRICAGDSIPDPFGISLTNDTVGTNRAWVITDTSLNILGLPAGPPFDLDGAGAGVCYVWYLAFEDGITGAEVGENAADLTGCFDLSTPITVTRDTGANCATTALRNALDPGQVKLFPNPVTNTLNLDLVDLSAATTIIELTDITGRLIERRRLSAATGRQTFDLSATPSGAYLLRVSNEGKSLTRRFIKQ